MKTLLHRRAPIVSSSRHPSPLCQWMRKIFEWTTWSGRTGITFVTFHLRKAFLSGVVAFMLDAGNTTIQTQACGNGHYATSHCPPLSTTSTYYYCRATEVIHSIQNLRHKPSANKLFTTTTAHNQWNCRAEEEGAGFNEENRLWTEHLWNKNVA